MSATNVRNGPIVYLTKKISFSAAHRLHSTYLDDNTNKRLFGKCNNLNGHGHNYILEVCLKGPINQESGMLINLSELKELLLEIVETLDHKFIDRDVEYFIINRKTSTVEEIAIYIYDMIKSKLPEKELLYSVKLHETDSNMVEYRGEIN